MERIGWIWHDLGAEALLTVAGLVPATVLAQIVIRGDGLTPHAQLALVIGLVVVQMLSVILLHRRRSDDERDS